MIMSILGVWHNFNNLWILLVLQVKLAIMLRVFYRLIQRPRFNVVIITVRHIYVPRRQLLEFVEIVIQHVLNLKLFPNWQISDLRKVLAGSVHGGFAENIHIR
jgi:hypothetical protein